MQMTQVVPTLGRSRKNQPLLAPEKLDSHANLSVQDKLKMRPSDLIPQLDNPAVRKREKKMIEKDMKRDRLKELAQDANQY